MWCLKNNFCLSVQSDEFLICVPREIASDLSLATFPVLSTILQASHILFGCLISKRSSLNLSSVSAHVRTIPYGTSPVLVLLYVFQLRTVKHAFISSPLQLIHEHGKW